MIKWNDNLKIGIEQIDQQHQQLFKEVNGFLDFLSANNLELTLKDELSFKIEDLFYFLTDYFVTHFSDEEKMQKELGYPKYEEHKRVHNNFINEINQLKYKFLDEAESIQGLAEVIEDNVLHWLIKHIGSEDKKIREYKDSLN